jgi:hypothetical protein
MPAKQIDVFLMIKPTERGHFARTVTRGGKTTVVGKFLEPGPLWSHLKAELGSKGYTLNVVGPGDPPVKPTVREVSASLSSAEVTVFVGHGAGDTSAPHFVAVQLLLNDGLIQSPDGMLTAKWGADGHTFFPDPNGALGKVKVKNVTGVFTCNSDEKLPAAFDVAEGGLLITNDGGADGETAIGTLEQAAYDFVRTYALNSGNVHQAMAAAQATFRQRAKRIPMDTGDTLHEHFTWPTRKTQPDPGDYYH